MKKLFFIFALVAVLSVSSVAIVSAKTCPCTLDGVNQSFECKDTETCGGCEKDAQDNIVNKCIPAGGGGGSGTALSGPEECAKLKADVTIQEPVAGGGTVDVTYKKDTILSSHALGAGVCKLAPIGISTPCSQTTDVSGTCWTGKFGIIVLLSVLNYVTGWIFYILMIVVTLMVIYGGFIYITAAGAPEKASQGKGVITYALIGLAIALLAKILPSVVKYIMGV